MKTVMFLDCGFLGKQDVEIVYEKTATECVVLSILFAGKDCIDESPLFRREDIEAVIFSDESL